MRSALLVLLLLSQTALASRVIVGFRLRKDPRATVRGWALDAGEEGFRFERIGGGRRLFVPWDALVDEDRARLRRRFKLDVSEEERLGLVSGHRLHFKGGGRADGLLERVDADEKHWLRRDGFLIPYPGDRVRRVEEIKVKDVAIYDEDELYFRRLQRTPPRTASQHRHLARYLEDVGHLEKAEEHYRKALRLQPGLRPELAPRLRAIEEIMADRAAYEALQRAKSAYRLRKDFDGGRAELERFLEKNPERRRMALQLLDDLEALRMEEMRKRFTAVKHEEFHAAVDRFLRTRPELGAALSWVRARLQEEMVKSIVARMSLERSQVEAFLAEEPRGASHWASYGSGSFVFSKRARKGTTTKKAVRGDPERWWARYGDLATRGSFLRAYAAERLPDLFEVVEVRTRDCEKCGGTGQIRHVSVKPLQDGRHEWKQVCPRCFKAGRDRSVAYR